MLIWSGYFQFPLDFLMRWSNEVNINPRVSKIKKLTPVLTTAIIIKEYRLEWSCNRIFFNLSFSEQWDIILLYEKEEKINIMVFSQKFTRISIVNAQPDLSLLSV